MPWVDRGIVNCPAGANTTLILVPRINFVMAAQVTDFPVGIVRYLGVPRYNFSLTGVTPSIDTEVKARPFWYNATRWEVGNAAAGGRIVFYAKQSNDFLLAMRVWEFVP